MLTRRFIEPLRFAVALLLALCLCAQAQAKRMALVIGNDQYQAVDKLKNARNDARLMASVLAKAGFEVTEARDLGRERLSRPAGRKILG